MKRVEGTASANAALLQRRVTDLEASLNEARRELSTLRTAAGSQESKATALERQLELAHSKALADIEQERMRLNVCSCTMCLLPGWNCMNDCVDRHL